MGVIVAGILIAFPSLWVGLGLVAVGLIWWLAQRFWSPPGGGVDDQKLSEECSRQAQRMEDFMLDRRSHDPSNRHRHDLPKAEADEQRRRETEYWHETGRLFQARLGFQTRRLLEALQKRGFLTPEQLEKKEIIRLGRVWPGEIDDLAHTLRSAAHDLQDS